MQVDVYPVGILRTLLRVRRILTLQYRECPGDTDWSWRINQILMAVEADWRYFLRNLKKRQWRAIRMTWNGYLAEPLQFPEGDYKRRAGTGWTKKRAITSLYRSFPK